MNVPWFSYVRAIMELLYFVAGIAIAAFAGVALQQITLTKRIAAKSAKRESIKFAAERCQYFAETCVALQTQTLEEHNRLKLTFLNLHLNFSIIEGEISAQGYNQALTSQQFGQMPAQIVTYLNSLEAFAIPFAAGVADDDIGFQETGTAFRYAIERFIGAIILLRATGVRYESAIRLYDRWKNRHDAQNIEGQMRKMQEQMKTASEKGKSKPAEAY